MASATPPTAAGSSTPPPVAKKVKGMIPDNSVTLKAGTLWGSGGYNKFSERTQKIGTLRGEITKMIEAGEINDSALKSVQEETKTPQRIELDVLLLRNRMEQLSTKQGDLEDALDPIEIDFPSAAYEARIKEYNQLKASLQSNNLPQPPPPPQPQPQSQFSLADLANLHHTQNDLEKAKKEAADTKMQLSDAQVEIELLKKKLKKIAVTGKMEADDKKHYLQESYKNQVEYAEHTAELHANAMQCAEYALRRLPESSPHHWNKVEKKMNADIAKMKEHRALEEDRKKKRMESRLLAEDSD